MAQSPIDDGSSALTLLRGVQELARQLLPLATVSEVARDGLLCIAGIRGLEGAALLWRVEERGSFELLSHFGLGAARVRTRYRIPAALLDTLSRGPATLDTARRRPDLRALVAAVDPIASRIGDGWIVALPGERGVRGIVILGRSLVTGRIPEPVDEVLELVDVLRLALVGRGSRRTRPGGRSVARAATEIPRAGAGTGPQLPAGRGSVARRLASLRRAHPSTAALHGRSAAVLAVLEQIVSLAQTSYTVLLLGETGTGKELAARLLHEESPRRAGPFETVDCASIPRELIESELFGHMRGAFTGAVRDFAGAFERANGGTLLLDEIGDMEPRSQARLLRVLQERSVRRVGGDRRIPVDVRVVAATNRDLAALVRAGHFRADLYYRIHVCLVQLPPLRERGDDRHVLYDAFMREHARELGRKPRALASDARRHLRTASFPGNIRQLQNVVRQSLVGQTRGPVSLAELEAVLERSAVAERDVSSVREPDPPRPLAPPAVGGHAPRPLRHEEDDGPVQEIGTWVIDQLRACRFNLRAASRTLQELRTRGAPRSAVPVCDRGALDYYLCGEFFQRLVRHGFDADAAIRELAGDGRFVARVRRKARAFMAPLLATGGGPDGVRRWPRVPETYHPDLEAVIAAVHGGRWTPPQA
jgi:DNA-binding NtrC family response regulator